MAQKSSPESRRPHPTIALLLFLTAAYTVGFIGAQATERGLDFWYVTLAKPSWNPPPWVFAPVWTVLYFLMGYAAWLVWKVPAGELPSGRRTFALTLFFVQLILNGVWSWLFFGFHRLELAFFEVGLLLLSIIAMAVLFGRCTPRAGWLIAPYIAWVAFATILNGVLWRMNL